MRKEVLVAGMSVAIAGAAMAQVPGLGGIRVRAGYGWSGSIDSVSGSRKLAGPELGFDFPLTQLPLVTIAFTGADLLGGQLSHGIDLDGYVYRFMLTGRASVPASKFEIFGGVGYATAQARNHEFGSINGFVSQLGVAIPLTSGLSTFSPSLEIAGSLASKSGLSGYSVSLAVRF